MGVDRLTAPGEADVELEACTGPGPGPAARRDGAGPAGRAEGVAEGGEVLTWQI